MYLHHSTATPSLGVGTLTVPNNAVNDLGGILY
jgi:hypothetical protein